MWGTPHCITLAIYRVASSSIMYYCSYSCSVSSHPTLLPISKSMSFDSVPILDLARARHPSTKPIFLSSLRDALLTVGFFYIKNTGIDDSLIQDVVEQGRAFFDLPQEEKLKIQMKNTKSCTWFPQHSSLLPHAFTTFEKRLGDDILRRICLRPGFEISMKQ